MSLAVALQMDPIQAIDINTDSTFMLAMEAQARGHTLCYYLPSDLALRDGRLFAKIQPIEIRREMGNHFSVGEKEVTARRAVAQGRIETCGLTRLSTPSCPIRLDFPHHRNRLCIQLSAALYYRFLQRSVQEGK